MIYKRLIIYSFETTCKYFLKVLLSFFFGRDLRSMIQIPPNFLDKKFSSI